MSSPLSHLQKREIAIAARRAYEAWVGREAFEAVNAEFSKTACFDSWRRVEQGKACGIQSLRECSQAHYGRILAHFQALGGATAAATRTVARDADNARRIALYKLRGELRKRGLSDEYAATICRSKFKCGMAEATEKQLWKLFYDVRKRPVRAPVGQIESEVPF